MSSRPLLPLLLLLLLLPIAVSLSGQASPQSFDCALRELALEYALALQPHLTAADAQSVADALNGSPQFGQYECGVTPPLGLPRRSPSPALPPHAVAAPTFYVDATAAAEGSGTLASPFRSLALAVAATRTGGVRTLILRAGTFFLGGSEQGGATIVLTPHDAGLTIAAYPGEIVWISGAAPLRGLSWARAANATGNVWQAVVPASIAPAGVPALRAGAIGSVRRYQRARYPNADSELGFGSSLLPNAWLPPLPLPTPTVWIDPRINRTDMNNGPGIQVYTLGMGGGCAAYEPPAGFWCSNYTVRFSGFDAQPRWPRGMTADRSVLPHSPYAHPEDAIVHAWHGGHWFTKSHTVGGYDADGNLTFNGGGFQGGEGEDSEAEFYVEGIYEELDEGGEFHWNPRTRVLSVFWNATGAPDDSLAAPQLRELFNVTSSQAAPIVNVSFLGLGFRDTAPSFLQPHGLPSGGDWAIARTGALFFEGVEGASIDGCTFERLEGTAVFLSGYSRSASVLNSTFQWLGESAVALWGWGEGSPVPRMGADLTGGHVPLFTRFEGCICREIGILQKQSSCLFQAEAGLSHVSRNLLYNGPRAAINFNEDSIGGSVVDGNLGFNWCRESGDHGAFNSWGRLPYLHNALGTGATTQKIWDQIAHNLFIANYNSMAALDHDDASAYYNASFNVFAYSPFGLKGDFGGHDNRGSYSVYAYLGGHSWFDGPAMVWITFGAPFVNHSDAFHNNLVVMEPCANDACSDGNLTIGQVCDVPALAAATPHPPTLTRFSALPPVGTPLLIALNASHTPVIRHCDFALYATPLGIGQAQDYLFNLSAALNGAPNAVSFLAFAFKDHYLAPPANAPAPPPTAGFPLAAVDNPDADDASWLVVPAAGGAVSLVSLSKRPELSGLLLTRAPSVTGPCVGVSGFAPPYAGDAVLSSAGGAPSAAQLWVFAEPPPTPPPPPGIAVTEVHDNTYYVNLPHGPVFECGVPLEQYQADCCDTCECDPRSVAHVGYPADSVLIAAARSALGL